MPSSITFDQIPVGHAAAPSGPGENHVSVLARGFLSSEDGDALVQGLEGFPSQVLSMLPPESAVPPSAVCTLLTIIRRDKSALVYLNDEIKIVGRALAKRSKIELGDPLGRDDIGDFQEISLQDIEVPRTAGFLFVFSVGWRKGYFYDLTPLQPKGARARNYVLEKVLAGFFNYLVFNELFKISDQDWDRLFAAQLFPFHALKIETIRNLLAYLREGWDVQPVVDQIGSEVDALLDRLPGLIAGNPHLQEHETFVAASVRHYRNEDYLSAISVLYPRIEGIMRSHHIATEAGSTPTPDNLVMSATGADDMMRSLLPDRFRRFMNEVFFQEFDPRNPAGMSRHTHAHGVAKAEEYSRNGACLGFLVLSQLAFFLAGFDVE